MKRRKLALGTLLLVIAAIALVFASASAGRTKASTPFKVAFIYVGPHNDGGWSQAHENGRLYAQKMLGSKVQTTYKENIAVGTQFSQTVASLVAQGYKMIFATSYGYITPADRGEVPERHVRAGDGHARLQERRRVLRPRGGHDLPLRHGGRRRAARPARSATSSPSRSPR